MKSQLTFFNIILALIILFTGMNSFAQNRHKGQKSNKKPKKESNKKSMKRLMMDWMKS